MDSRKLERIVIIILLLLDLFLLSMLAADRLQARRSRQETLERVTALLEVGGIRSELSALPETPAVCTLVRDGTLEAERVSALIGAASVTEQGGGIRYYTGVRGQAVLRGNGAIELLFQGEGAGKGDVQKLAQRLFSRAGLTLNTPETDPNDPTRMLSCCLWDGVPVYNAQLVFDLSADSIYMVTGTMLFQKETERSTEGLMDAVTALTRFLDAVRREGFICSRVEEISAVYRMDVTVSGESVLTPLWRIRTDTGSLYFNALTGKTESAEL